jgi:hypothetical protein
MSFVSSRAPIYYGRHSGNLAEQTLSQLRFATSRFAFGSQNGGATVSQPFGPPVLPASSYPVFQSRTPDSFPFIEGTNPDLRDGKTYEYNLALRYQLGRNILNVGYVGNPNTPLGYSDPSIPNPVASASFGRITGEQGGPHPRIIQLAARYSF